MKQLFGILGLSALVLAVVWILVVEILPGLTRDTSSVTRVYFADNISPAHRLAIAEFNRLFEGRIEVVPVDLPFDKFSTNERKELLARSLRSKSDKLDVLAVDQIWVPRFAKWAEPLGETVTTEERTNLMDYALETCIVDGNLVALPLYIDIGMMYYRADIIRTLPDAAAIEEKLAQSITWEELDGLRVRLGYENRPFYIFQAKDYEGLVCNFFELARNRDASFFDRKGVDLRLPAARDALSWMVRNVDKKSSPPQVVEFDENLSYQYMLDHDAVFVRGWPNFVENFRSFYGDTAKLRAIRKAALPHFKGTKPVSVFGGWNLMIARSSGKKEAALEFVRFMNRDAVQKIMFDAGGYIPVVKSVYSDSLFLDRNSELRYYRQLLRRGFHRPALPEYTKTSDVISHFVHLAIKKQVSPQQAVAIELWRAAQRLLWI